MANTVPPGAGVVRAGHWRGGAGGYRRMMTSDEQEAVKLRTERRETAVSTRAGDARLGKVQALAVRITQEGKQCRLGMRPPAVRSLFEVRIGFQRE